VFKLFSQLPKTDRELRAHIRGLAHLTGRHDHQALFDHLYGCLSILDSKSASLLQFNSIICAVYAIFMVGSLTRPAWMEIHLGMTFVLISSLLLLTVVWVHWSTTDHLENLEAHMLILLRVRRERTIKYRLAWYLSVLSLLTLAVFLAQRFVVQFPVARAQSSG
jgi:hypothetical protein